MTDNENNNPPDPATPVSPMPEQSVEEPHHHFDAEIPSAAKKKVKHGSFSTGFTPRRETSFAQSKKAEFAETPVKAASETASAAVSETVSKESPKESPKMPPHVPPKRQEGAHLSSPPIPTTSWFSGTVPTDKAFEKLRLIVLLAVMVPLSLFAYWPALCEIVYAWYSQLDYGHGFFVIPLVIFFIYIRLDNYPGTHYRLTWIGLFPLIVCCLMRLAGAQLRMDAMEQWSILLWVLSIVWFFYGNRVFFWALPSLLFLIFMFQLPWSFEVLLRNHLQQIAAQFAAVLLQLLGEPAIAIKNTIRLSTMELAVEQACSGIRFLISIFAISFATILLMKRPWWQNICILIAAVPIALFVNAARIATTGILLLHFHGFVESVTPEGGNPSVIADEMAGIFMIFVALGIFSAFIYYLGMVFRRVEI